MAIEFLPRDARAADVKAELDRSGYAVVRDWLDLELVENIHRDISRYADRVVGLELEFFGDGALKKVEGLAAKSASVVDVMSRPLLAELAEAFLGADPLLNASGGFVLEKGRRPQPLHHDDVLYQPFLPRRPGEFESMLNCMIAITDFRRENGATRMVPGSHLWPEGRLPTEADPVVDVEMPPGSAAFWLGSTWHGAGQNTTDRARIGCELGFNCGWLRPHENYQLLIPPGLARDLPLQVQELLGYKAHRGMLGCIEQRSPMEVFGFEKRRPVHAVVREAEEAAAPVDPRELERAVRRFAANGERALPTEASRLLERLARSNRALEGAGNRAERDMLEVVAVADARSLTVHLEGIGWTEPIEDLKRGALA